MRSRNPEPVNFFGAQSSFGGAQFSFGGAQALSWGARPWYVPPRGAGSGKDSISVVVSRFLNTIIFKFTVDSTHLVGYNQMPFVNLENYSKPGYKFWLLF